MHTNFATPDAKISMPTPTAGGGRTRQEIADEALDGWACARSGAPFDPTESEAWQAGWQCWHEARDAR